VDRIKNKNRYRVITSILVTAIILSSVLSFPTSVAAISVSQTTPNASYLLGATVPLPADINFIPSDNAPIKQITLNIAGPQPLTVDLPIAPGSFSLNTTGGIVSGTVTWDNVGYGTGYGYGSNPSAASRIRYNPLNWKPVLLRNPPPPGPGPSLPGWENVVGSPNNQFIRGMGYDSSNNRLYVVVDAFPNDRIIVLDTNNNFAQINAFDGPSDSVEAADFANGGAAPGLYIADTFPTFGFPNGKIYQYTQASGQTPSNSFPAPTQVGGLAFDGTNLLAASMYGNQLFKLNPANGNQVGQMFFLNSPQGQPYYGGPLPGAHALAFYGTNNNLLWSTSNQIARIDMGGQNPVVQNFENIQPGMFIEGLAMVGDYAYMGGYEMGNPSNMKIVKSRHPGAPPIDQTVAGSYTAQIVVTGSLLATGPAVNFALKKIGDSGMPGAVVVSISAPADGSAVQSTSVNVTGSVNDPSITAVSVGATIGASEFIRDKVELVVVPAGQTTNQIWNATGFWHVSEDRSLQQPGDIPTIKVSGQKSWAYNQSNQFGGPPNYDNGQINNGSLETKDAYSVGGGSKLAFWTGWNTEPPQQFDKKIIEVSENGGPWNQVAQIVEAGFFGGPPPMFGMPGQGGLMPWGVDTNPQSVDASSGFVQVQVPQFMWKQVVLDFKNRFNGKNIKIRFHFDTVDPSMNFMEGWYVDQIVFKAESALGGQQATVDSNLNFSTTVTIGEGSNPISVVATSGYSSAMGSPGYLTGQATTTVSLDITGPVVTIDAASAPAVTSSGTATVTGTVTESNLKAQTETPAGVAMSQVSDGGTKPYTPTVTGTGASKTFSQVVNLVAGTNTLTVTATDKAGLTGSASATVVYDIIPPSITAGVTLYPVGEVSARANDFFVFQAEATDFGIGVTAVQLLMPFSGAGLPPGVTQTQLDTGNEQTGSDSNTYQKISSQVYNLLPFVRASNIPQAIRTQWGVTGTITDRWLMPMNLPSSAFPGTYSLTARAKDGGGNTTTATVTAQVVSTLSKFNIYLMPGPDQTTPAVPGWNLISTPLIPNDTSMGTVMTGLQAKGLQSIWYYNTATNTWLSYDPSSQANSLTSFETGKGYWVRMNTSMFTYDDPLATGLPQTPRPVKLTISGQVLQAGNQPPPTYAIKSGWNLIGLHNEHDTAATTALAGLTSPFGARIWASLLEYKNFVKYPTQRGESPETVLGAFASVPVTGTMNPGKGYWLFATADGSIMP